MTEPLVSIIMPVWNGEQWLEQAINSVLKQSYRHWELVVINNGSTDASFHLIQQFSDSRIRSFQQAHSGVSSARNMGLTNARGTFICFLDCDDQLPPQSVEARVKAFEAQPSLGFVDGTVEVWDAHFSVQTASFSPTFTGPPLDELCRLSGTCFYGITWMIRSEAIGEVRFNINMSHSEDLAFFATLANSNWDYGFVQNSIYQVRKREGSAMSNLDGLSKGYELLFEHLNSLRPKKSDWQQTFKGRVRRILVRSYLKKLQFTSALRSQRRWS